MILVRGAVRISTSKDYERYWFHWLEFIEDKDHSAYPLLVGEPEIAKNNEACSTDLFHGLRK